MTFGKPTYFFVKKYKGNPLRAHLEVDKGADYQIDKAHFGNWLNLWFETLDELFQGKNVKNAKYRARNMAHIIFIKI